MHYDPWLSTSRNLYPTWSTIPGSSEIPANYRTGRHDWPVRKKGTNPPTDLSSGDLIMFYPYITIYVSSFLLDICWIQMIEIWRNMCRNMMSLPSPAGKVPWSHRRPWDFELASPAASGPLSMSFLETVDVDDYGYIYIDIYCTAMDVYGIAHGSPNNPDDGEWVLGHYSSSRDATSWHPKSRVAQILSYFKSLECVVIRTSLGKSC